jgi:uracil-DNA glycosylase family 4
MAYEEIVQQLEFLRDIGLDRLDLAQRARPAVQVAAPVVEIVETAVVVTPDSPDSLESIRADIGDCQRCKLAPTRTHIVFGSGNPHAELVFVGEAPGFDEDQQGLPFVGAAGQLLTKIIESTGVKREETYICNILKCRPPNNRNPEPDEVMQCSPFLKRQLEAIKPKIVCCLGKFAAQNLLQSMDSITRLRGSFHDIDGMRVIATFHPAYLLRSPEKKREVWDDMKAIRAELFRLRF